MKLNEFPPFLIQEIKSIERSLLEISSRVGKLLSGNPRSTLFDDFEKLGREYPEGNIPFSEIDRVVMSLEKSKRTRE